MTYSDRDMIVATQIAYYDIPDQYTGKSLREALKNSPNILKHIQENLKKSDPLERARAQKQLELYNEIISPNSRYGNWIIKDVKNDNANTGFYGCLIETDNHSAIVAFRGSEGAVNGQLQRDWIQADFGLLNAELTKQQAVATEYMKQINQKYHYDNYVTSGHSLGGNLAAHAGLTAPPEMQKKITQCYNMDGPGFSDEYLKTYRDEIERFSNKITHYQWSVVGNLLNRLPGEKFETKAVNEYVDGKNDFHSLTQRHDTGFVVYDENGMIVNGEQDPFAAALGRISRSLDDADLGSVLVVLLDRYFSMTPNEQKAVLGLIVAGVVELALLHSAVVGAVVITAIAIIGIAVKIPDFFINTVMPFLAGAISLALDAVALIKSTVEKFLGEVLEGFRRLKEGVLKLMDHIRDTIARIQEWAFRHSPGYAQANANPNIVINTASMERYAHRLQAVARRARALDSQMNSYYWQLAIEWDATRAIFNLGRFLRANVLMDFSYRLDRCATCLSSTARDFEQLEDSLSRM